MIEIDGVSKQRIAGAISGIMKLDLDEMELVSLASAIIDVIAHSVVSEADDECPGCGHVRTDDDFSAAFAAAAINVLEVLMTEYDEEVAERLRNEASDDEE